MKNSSKTTIKCKFSNEINKIMNSYLNETEKKSKYYRKTWLRKDKINNLSDKEKLNLLNKIVETYETISLELNQHLDKKRQKRKVQKARIERGYVPKKKTKKEDYLKTKQL